MAIGINFQSIIIRLWALFSVIQVVRHCELLKFTGNCETSRMMMMTSFPVRLFSLEKRSPDEGDESHLISYGEWFQWNKSNETIILNVRLFFSGSFVCVDDERSDEWAIKKYWQMERKAKLTFLRRRPPRGRRRTVRSASRDHFSKAKSSVAQLI